MTLLLSLVCIFSAGKGWASNEKDYYSAKVPVSSQSAIERQRAATVGLREVLLRVSGSQDIFLSGKLTVPLKEALRYIEQFKYEANDEAPTQPDSEAAEQYKQVVQLVFSASVIEQILRDAELRFWPINNRPKTLVWLVEDSFEYGKQLLNQENDVEITHLLEQASWERGLPIYYPFLDLDDHIALPAEKAWSLDEAAIKEASSRYNADVILVGRYTRTSRGQILSSWQYFHFDDTRVYDNRAQSTKAQELTLFGRRALYPLADFLADKYSIVPRIEKSQGVLMTLNGINNYRAYREAMNYLEGLAAVKSVGVSEVRSDSVLLNLNTDMPVARLANTIELDKRLHESESQFGSDVPVWQRAEKGSHDNPLVYTWSK